MATHQTIGAFHRGWRLMGLDGTTLDVPDTPANARTFGRPTTGRAAGAFPQVRLLALCELGTHAICGLAIKPLCHGGTQRGRRELLGAGHHPVSGLQKFPSARQLVRELREIT
jgi:hypothetical protein